jgi:hypothetical protein
MSTPKLPSKSFDEKSTSAAHVHGGKKGDADVYVRSAVDVELLDESHGDDALKLVGTRRRAEFSEEYNRALRIKLVSFFPHLSESTLIGTFANVGSMDSSALRCCIFYSVSVSTSTSLPQARPLINAHTATKLR